MCGIYGVVNGSQVTEKLLGGLRRLEYRGYDSAGIAVGNAGRIRRMRSKGKIARLEQRLGHESIDGPVGIAHTRWATHGAPTELNAHPHATERVAVVHNGIIENHAQLREELVLQGVRFSSETDTEVVPQLINAYLEQGASPIAAVRATLERLRGSYALGILFREEGTPGRLVASRCGSPLVIGVSGSETVLCSDLQALDTSVNSVIFLEDGDVAELDSHGVRVFDRDGLPADRPARPREPRHAPPDKGPFAHFMEKEIHEQPLTIARTLSAYLDPDAAGLARLDAIGLRDLARLGIVACGSSYYAGMLARHWFEGVARLPVDMDIASEFRYREVFADAGTTTLFLSQSGETADTLAALRLNNGAGARSLAMVNAQGSTMGREAGVLLPTHAGPEIGVAATKSFTAQLAALAGLALHAARRRGTLDAAALARFEAALRGIPRVVAGFLERGEPAVREIARSLAGAPAVLFVGRGSSHAVALEGALKLKETSYVFADAYAAGELKHGPIALLEPSLPVVALAPGDALLAKTLSNVEEILARGAPVILLTDADVPAGIGDRLLHLLRLPRVDPLVAPILATVALQMLAYHVALLKGTDVDQPRNLAKSVTVE